MAPASLHDRFEHILEAVGRVQALWSGKSYQDYVVNRDLAAATERYLEKICEATKYIPEDRKARHPDIPWSDIRALGNILRHAYDQVNPEIIWKIVVGDLASLRAAVELMLEEERA